jgi:hypothetical protein
LPLFGAAIYIAVLSFKKMANTFPPGGGDTTSSHLKIFLFIVVAILLFAIGGALVLQVLLG